MPLGEVLQVKLKLLSLGPSLCIAGWLDSMSRLGDFPAPGGGAMGTGNEYYNGMLDCFRKIVKNEG